MTRYLLDTNVVSELRKAKPHGGVLAWIGRMRNEQLLISAVTMGELQIGVERTRQDNPEKAKEIETWIDQLAGSLSIVPMDAACFREWGRLIAGQPNQINEDMMIAATARVYELTLATRNEKDFVRAKIDIVNPFKTQR